MNVALGSLRYQPNMKLLNAMKMVSKNFSKVSDADTKGLSGNSFLKLFFSKFLQTNRMFLIIKTLRNAYHKPGKVRLTGMQRRNSFSMKLSVQAENLLQWHCNAPKYEILLLF